MVRYKGGVCYLECPLKEVSLYLPFFNSRNFFLFSSIIIAVVCVFLYGHALIMCITSLPVHWYKCSCAVLILLSKSNDQ